MEYSKAARTITLPSEDPKEAFKARESIGKILVNFSETRRQMSYVEGATWISGLDSSHRHPPPTPFLLFLGQLASTTLKKKNCMCFLRVCMHTPGACRGQKITPDSLERELQKVMSHNVSADNRIQVLCKCS